MKKIFNIIIGGVGGQGAITVGKILAEAAFLEKKEIKMSELHGLSQRGGSVNVHLRIGEDMYSPLVGKEKADLILILEKNETFSNIDFISKSGETIFLINDFIIPSPASQNVKFENEEIKNLLKDFSKNVFIVPASKIAQEKFGNEAVSGVILISFAAFKNLLPIKPTSIYKAIKKVIPKKYLELNLKAFNFAKTI
jgi:indolepyruvate ferredoxin oxidoreductase beta subunit